MKVTVSPVESKLVMTPESLRTLLHNSEPRGIANQLQLMTEHTGKGSYHPLLDDYSLALLHGDYILLMVFFKGVVDGE